MQIDPSIFKSYDIRGIYGQNLFDSTAEAVARAFIKYLNFPKEVIVGKDGRISGKQLSAKLIKTLTLLGTNVIDIGLTSTDMFYFACAEKKLPGIMVTASHNPKEYNGFKMVKHIPFLLSGDEGIGQMREMIKNDELPANATKVGTIRKLDVMPDFINKIASLIDAKSLKPMTVLADMANGMGGTILENLKTKLPTITFVPMYWEVDGTFPNHGGDPLQLENRQELMARVPKDNADLGIAFDPDGDRFFVVDKTGRFISGDFMTAILSDYFLKRYPGSPIVYDIRASQVVPDTINRAGGKPLYNRVGHSHIKPRMINEKACFGGEVSGHYYFSDFYYCDSAAVSMLFLLEFLSKSPKRLDQIVDEMESKYFISGEINSTVTDIPAKLAQVEKKYAANAKEIIHIDGITMEMGDWRFNLRGSNTEPLLRLCMEAKNKKLMEEKRDELLQLIRS